jgi:hypothetical protein
VLEPLGDLTEAVARLVDELEQTALPYALGGAIAYSTWAEPRATSDIDLNLWLPLDDLDRGFAALESAGVTVDRGAAIRDATERGMFVARSGEYRVDVFVPSIPFYDEALARRRRVKLAARETWVLSPEVLAVFKMLFFRPKDVVDVGRLMEIQGRGFDHAFVRRWLVEMLGEDDERIARWDEMVAEPSRSR